MRRPPACRCLVRGAAVALLTGLAPLFTAACGGHTVAPRVASASAMAPPSSAAAGSATVGLPGPTMPPATGPGKRFVAWGDVRSWGADPALAEGFGRVVTALSAKRFSASVAVGDYIYADGDATADRARYEAFLAGARPILAKGPVVWVPGNHERLTHEVDHQLWHEMIWQEEVPSGDPETNQRHHWGAFSLSVGGKTMHVFMLSSDDVEAPEGTIGFKTAKRDTTSGSAWMTQTNQARALANWLRRRPRSQYVVIAVHHPLLDPKADAAYVHEPHTTERDKLVRLFSRSGVDLVLQGDVHNYRRHVAPSGTVYLTQGMGGAPPDAAVSTGPDDDVAARDDRDRSVLGSELGGGDRYGFTIFRQTKDGRIKGMTYFVSDEDETVGGKTYAAGTTVLFDVFLVPRLAKRY